MFYYDIVQRNKQGQTFVMESIQAPSLKSAKHILSKIPEISNAPIVGLRKGRAVGKETIKMQREAKTFSKKAMKLFGARTLAQSTRGMR